MAGRYDLENTPDSEVYRCWFQSIESKIKPVHRRVLREHYLSVRHTASATQIAQYADITGGHPVVNRLYGELGHWFCNDTGFCPVIRDGRKYWWTVWSSGEHTRTQGFLWTMHTPVAEALELLGWVDSVPEHVFQETVTSKINLVMKDSDEKILRRIAQASLQPEEIRIFRTEYKRNPDIVVLALRNAKGRCEICGSLAPFLRASDGTPYLEVHHRVPLSDGGEDSLENVVAICPNCHREIHHGCESEKHRMLKRRSTSENS